MNKQIELKQWVVMCLGQESGRYRFRGDAEVHAQNLKRLSTKEIAATVEVVFDHARVSLR